MLWTAVLLWVSAPLQFLSVSHCHTLLVVLRPRSLATRGFERFSPFTLPAAELDGALRAETAGSWGVLLKEPLGTSEQVRPLELRPLRTESDDSGVLSALAKAAQRCVLLHGLYELLSEAADPLEAAAQGVENLLKDSRTDAGSVADHGWSLDALVCGSHRLSRAEKQVLLEGPATLLEGLPFPLGRSWHRPRGLAPLDLLLCWDRSTESCSPVRLLRRLASGAAVGDDVAFVRREREGEEVQARGGVLSVYALHKRPCVAGTALCPELAFIAANLAAAPPNGSVIDPCGGSGSLLIAAAACGCRVVAMDVDGVLVEASRSNFQALGLGVAGFYQGDITEKATWPGKFRDGFDAILCDPPYDMKARVTRSVPAIIEALLAFAAEHLRVGCRAAVFLPSLRGDASGQWGLPAERLDMPSLPQSLRLVACFPQYLFKRRFTRSLCILEKCR